MSSNDILQIISLEKWRILRDSLKINWPEYAHYYYLIDNAFKWKVNDSTWEANFYCPNGEPNAGVFLYITHVPIYSVLPFAFEERTNILLECLIETKQIDWNKTVNLRGIHSPCLDTVEKALNYLTKTKKFLISDRACYEHYMKSEEDCKKVEIKVADDFELRPLECNTHILNILYDEWNYGVFKQNSESCKKFLSNVLRLNKSIGLFTKKENKLVAWALENEWSGIGMVNTIDGYKRRGFAKIVVNMIAKILTAEGLDVNLMISHNNDLSKKLFTSLGWQMTGSQNRMTIQPLYE